MKYRWFQFVCKCFQITALKTEKRQRDQQRKQKITENRKHLANVRVMQKNLVFVVGLPPRLADPEVNLLKCNITMISNLHFVVAFVDTEEARVLWKVWKNPQSGHQS